MIVRFKVQKSNKPTIALINIVLTFEEIDNKESIIDFQKFQTLWLLKKNHEFIKRKLIYRQSFVYIKSRIMKRKVSKFKEEHLRTAASDNLSLINTLLIQNIT